METLANRGVSTNVTSENPIDSAAAGGYIDSAAAGGYVLYPNKPNTNMTRSVYSK